MLLQNLFTILIILIFLPFHIILCCQNSKTSLNSQLKDDNFVHCKYGIYSRFVPFCDCSNVIGNGTKCEIEKPFNNTDFQVIFLCLQKTSQSWKKNIEIQFPGESITNIEENEIYVKGFVNKSLLIFEIYYFCEKPSKNIFWWPRLSKTEKVITSAFVNSSKQIKEKDLSGHPKFLFYKKPEDISPKCKFGMDKQSVALRMPYCDCTNVFGNGTYCEISLKRNSHYKCLLCLIYKSEAWKKNLETQFSETSINIIEEGEKFAKGSIENHISFEVFYFCERHAKNIFLWPQQSNYSSKNNSPYFGNRNVKNVNNILNQTGTVKVSDTYGSKYKWVAVIVVVPLIILSFILYYKREEIKKKFNGCLRPPNKRSRTPTTGLQVKQSITPKTPLPDSRNKNPVPPSEETQNNRPLIPYEETQINSPLVPEEKNEGHQTEESSFLSNHPNLSFRSSSNPIESSCV